MTIITALDETTIRAKWNLHLRLGYLVTDPDYMDDGTWQFVILNGECA